MDKEDTAIDRLAKGVAPYHPNLNYQVVAVHPKRPDVEQLRRFQELALSTDVFDWQYFRTSEMLRKMFPFINDRKHILTHQNPYSIYESDWNSYDVVIANNKTIFEKLKKITQARVEFIPLAVEHKFWKFNPEYKFDRSILMVANRIESKKGILPVAVAAKEIGAKFILVGSVSDGGYFNEIMDTGNVEFHEKITDEALRDLYYRAGVHVCNSVDDFESGTMPILEAMYCGTPVLTRKVGHVPDLYNEKNMMIQTEESDAVEYIAPRLNALLGDHEKLKDLRNNAWDTVKSRNFERRAYSYQQLYRSVMHPEEEPVSIIVPISDNPDVTHRCLEAIAKQTYKNIELIVSDDGQNSSEDLVKTYAVSVPFPVRYIGLPNTEGYNLAEARNRGIIEATGDILVFVDQRMGIAEDAVEKFVNELKPTKWVYGSKGVKKPFVENFSAIYRSDLVRMGMFNERCDRYGAMSQEIRSRAIKQGYTLEYVAEAKSVPSKKSSNKHNKKLDIINSKNWLWKVGLE